MDNRVEKSKCDWCDKHTVELNYIPPAEHFGRGDYVCQDCYEEDDSNYLLFN